MEFDSAFINKLKENDAKSQRLFYQHLAPKMYGICLRFALVNEDADDILQDGFIRVFRHIKDFRGEGSFEGWVRRTIVNTAINYYKKKIKQGITTDLEYVKGKLKERNDILEKMTCDELRIIINELPPGYRMVFNLSAIEGYTHKEIGKMLEISENTSKSQLSRARASLQKSIAKIQQKENGGKG
ncbi:MAG: RNA polymerase sigma factor [Lentimicrobiaceae bacterium]|jgi:RNA polymerase sigma-70 factor (ECF subfamily)|nr:RNA polymerase sigma factor [Lentimicrobiaceae bacterium]MBT6016460.1 RNA polymerase sigma factor [Lentimicrobiaceae bacterium]MBT6672508.1 RNA polymerase sigma factor [Lentimicrobiaceae bacterium]MBT6962576.1 RNA polymerase sigma factor [Lentimicrobiaceae bacterium]MCP4910818.1 RNA polymerase sigma factor [Bacteroidota bacterium]